MAWHGTVGKIRPSIYPEKMMRPHLGIILWNFGVRSFGVERPLECCNFTGKPSNWLNMHTWLVVWLPFFIFPYIGNLIIPIDELIFFRGVAQPPTRFVEGLSGSGEGCVRAFCEWRSMCSWYVFLVAGTLLNAYSPGRCFVWDGQKLMFIDVPMLDVVL